jgi:hypothetical protein
LIILQALLFLNFFIDDSTVILLFTGIFDYGFIKLYTYGDYEYLLGKRSCLEWIALELVFYEITFFSSSEVISNELFIDL